MMRVCLTSALLAKLAKHLAIVACLAIIGAATGRFAIAQIGIFLLVVLAALLHSVARTMERPGKPPALAPSPLNSSRSGRTARPL